MILTDFDVDRDNDRRTEKLRRKRKRKRLMSKSSKKGKYRIMRRSSRSRHGREKARKCVVCKQTLTKEEFIYCNNHRIDKRKKRTLILPQIKPKLPQVKSL